MPATEPKSGCARCGWCFGRWSWSHWRVAWTKFGAPRLGRRRCRHRNWGGRLSRLPPPAAPPSRRTAWKGSPRRCSSALPTAGRLPDHAGRYRKLARGTGRSGRICASFRHRRPRARPHRHAARLCVLGAGVSASGTPDEMPAKVIKAFRIYARKSPSAAATAWIIPRPCCCSTAMANMPG